MSSALTEPQFFVTWEGLSYRHGPFSQEDYAWEAAELPPEEQDLTGETYRPGTHVYSVSTRYLQSTKPFIR